MLQRLEQPTAAPFALRHLLGASLDAAKQAALQGIPPLAELQKLAADWEQACSTPTDRPGPQTAAADPTGLDQQGTGPQAEAADPRDLDQRGAAPQASQDPELVQQEGSVPVPFVKEAMRLLADEVHHQLQEGQAQPGAAEAPGGRDPLSLLALCKTSAASLPSANRQTSLSLGLSAGLEGKVTQVMATLRPHQLQMVVMSMAQRVPRRLEALLLHVLPPAAAEILTHKLEAAAEGTEAAAGQSVDQQAFYQQVYGACADPQHIFERLLHQKEAFSRLLLSQITDALLS